MRGSYRTAIFFSSPEQEAAAKKSKQAIEASATRAAVAPWPRKLLRGLFWWRAPRNQPALPLEKRGGGKLAYLRAASTKH